MRIRESESSFRLSYSNISMAKTCLRKFFMKYMLHLEPDLEEDQTKFFFGTVFHQYLENGMHLPELGGETSLVTPRKKRGLQPLGQTPLYVSEEKLEAAWLMCLEDSKPSVKAWHPSKHTLIKHQVGAALQTFFIRHLKSNLTCIACEVEIAFLNFIAYIDVVYVDTNGYWWIGDLKTAASVKPQELTAQLSKNLQLSIYATFKQDVARILSLDLAKFAGVRYLSTTKTKAEEIKSFESFCIKNVSESYDFVVPAHLLSDSIETLNYHLGIVEQLEELKGQGYTECQIKANYSACFDFFSPCPWWSRCYGHKFGTDTRIKVFTTSSRVYGDEVIEEESLLGDTSLEDIEDL